LVLVNTRVDAPAEAVFSAPLCAPALTTWVDLLNQPPPKLTWAESAWRASLAPGAAYCLSAREHPVGLPGEAYRLARARAAWAVSTAAALLPPEVLGGYDWQKLAERVDVSPESILNAISLSAERAGSNPWTLEVPAEALSRVITWTQNDHRRLMVVPEGHWLLIEDSSPFRAALSVEGTSTAVNVQSLQAGGRHIASFPPQSRTAGVRLWLERYGTSGERHLEAALVYAGVQTVPPPALPSPESIVLLTNGRGGMCRMAVDLGRIQSKYDCVLGANLHPEYPVDRHVFAKRLRVWINADGFLSPLDYRCLKAFRRGPPAVWEFVANAGDGRTVQITLEAGMISEANTVRFEFSRPSAGQASGKQLPPEADVRLTIRVDIEDRNFHWETRRNGSADHHFHQHTSLITAELPLTGVDHQKSAAHGFLFAPTADRRLRVVCHPGMYHPGPEWAENLPHPVEHSRGMQGAGDAFSPGWFEVPLGKGATAELWVDAENGPLQRPPDRATPTARATGGDPLASELLAALDAFVVRRGEGKTVIAGYPWFLDWGRDTFIAARGLLAAGRVQEVADIIRVFARFEENGTLPNSIHGVDAANRDTSDAPLWFGIVCEECAAQSIDPARFFQQTIGPGSRTLAEVLLSIANHYAKGTPNGISMDTASALIWSPSHFTWMDTNYPACTPRAGYPVEIQALWIRFLRLVARLNPTDPVWPRLSEQALRSVEQRFWVPERSWYADLLSAPGGEPADRAAVDDALRSNSLWLVALD
jgi:hypothetical protein